MQLEIKDGAVLSWADGGTLTARAGATIVEYDGSLAGLGRVGDLSEDWPAKVPDPRRYAAPADAKAPAPSIISDRQFAQQAAVQGLITDDEALAWVSSGVIPPEMLTLVTQLPAAAQFGAKMMLAGSTTFDRTHPLTAELTSAFGWSETQRDAFWSAAAAL